MLWIAFLTAINSQFYLRASEYSLGLPASPPDAPVLQVCLGSHNEERLRTMYAIGFLEVIIATVEDVVSACFNGDFLHHCGIADRCWRDVEKRGNLSLHIVLGMNLYSTLVLAEFCPPEHIQT